MGSIQDWADSVSSEIDGMQGDISERHKSALAMVKAALARLKAMLDSDTPDDPQADA